MIAKRRTRRYDYCLENKRKGRKTHPPSHPMNDKMKTAISIIAIACLCACMTPTKQPPSQPTPEENANNANQNWREWIELTSQEWDAIIQQLSDRELYYVGGGMLTSTDILDLQIFGISPYPPRITPELKSALIKYARRKAEAEMTRRGISTELPPMRDYERESEPLQIPLIREPTDEEQMERIDHTFPRRFWGIDPPDPTKHTNYTDEVYFSRLVSNLSLPELKEWRKEYASKMNDNEILITERQIKDMEKGEWSMSHMTDYLKQLYEESRKATHKQNEE